MYMPLELKRAEVQEQRAYECNNQARLFAGQRCTTCILIDALLT